MGINAEALRWAMDHASPKGVERYNKLGQKYVVDVAAGDKKVCTAGPCWIWASLEYQGSARAKNRCRSWPPPSPLRTRTPTLVTKRRPTSSMCCPAPLVCTTANYCRPHELWSGCMWTAIDCTTPLHLRANRRR